MPWRRIAAAAGRDGDRPGYRAAGDCHDAIPTGASLPGASSRPGGDGADGASKMTFGVTFDQIIVAALAGDPFGRLRFLGRDLLLVLFLATLIVPFEVIVVFRQFFVTIPLELEEAMRVDGAGYYRIFWSLMLPLAGPAVATVFILIFLAEWSSLLKPLVFTSSENLRTLQQGLNFLSSGAFVTEPRIAWLMAGVVLVSIPPIVVFLPMQERFVRSIVATGLKE